MKIPDNSWFYQDLRVAAAAKRFDPRAKVQLKTGWVWKMSPALKNSATAIMDTVYFPVDWTAESCCNKMCHEVKGHVKQFSFFGFGNPKVGIVLMTLIYGLLFFPILLAWGRYRLELHACATEWEHFFRGQSGSRGMEDYILNAWSPHQADSISGKMYVYAVPHFWARWGYKRKAKKVIAKVKADLA